MQIIYKPADEEFSPDEPLLASLISNDGMLSHHLERNVDATRSFILSVPAEKWLFRYASGKWTIKETLMHLADMERIYTYRALRFARNDQTTLPGFDAGLYAASSGANYRDIDALLDELQAIRRSTIMFLNGLTADALSRRGPVNGHFISVRALLYHIAGHELHHMNIIRERYL